MSDNGLKRIREFLPLIIVVISSVTWLVRLEYQVKSLSDSKLIVQINALKKWQDEWPIKGELRHDTIQNEQIAGILVDVENLMKSKGLERIKALETTVKTLSRDVFRFNKSWLTPEETQGIRDEISQIRTDMGTKMPPQWFQDRVNGLEDRIHELETNGHK